MEMAASPMSTLAPMTHVSVVSGGSESIIFPSESGSPVEDGGWVDCVGMVIVDVVGRVVKLGVLSASDVDVDVVVVVVVVGSDVAVVVGTSMFLQPE